MPAWVVPAFVVGAVLSLLGSSRLVRSLESLGEHFAMPELLLGLVVAAAADGPELTSAVTAMVEGQRTVGVGVLLGSNVFNIAALLGLGTVVAGRLLLHRRVVVLEAITALGVAVPSCAFVTGRLGPVAASAIALVFFLPYLVVALVHPRRLPLPGKLKRWLAVAVLEEESELAAGLHDVQRARPDGPGPGVPGKRRAAAWAGAALVVVVAASALMERAGAVGGASLGLPQVIVGGVVLAAVTSLPNAVAAVHLARAGRGAALMAEAMNSNSINVVGGLVVPALVGGLVITHAGRGAWLTAGAYMLMTLLVLGMAGWHKGLGRVAGTSLALLYLAYVVVLATLG